MTQPYGQQPGDQGQQGGGFPQAPSYQQGIGGMPQAPQEYSGGPVARPGSTTTAAVLAFVQGGITLLTTGILMLGLAAVQDAVNKNSEAGGVEIQGSLAEAWIVSIVQLVGVALLIFGGVKMLAGTHGPLFLAAVGLQIALCIYWLIRGAAPLVPLVLIVMPIIAVFMALSSANKQYVQSRLGTP